MVQLEYIKDNSFLDISLGGYFFMYSLYIGTVVFNRNNIEIALEAHG